MSIHKLTAGHGYDYLTRQVAALDATDKGHAGLASYYTERGETPGVWAGSGLGGIDGLAAGDVVRAEQMRALFGAGMHPLAADRVAAFEAPSLKADDCAAVARLGTPFKVFSPDVSPYRREVAARIAAINAASGSPGDWPVEAAVRAQVRTDVAVDFFTAEHGRPPSDARELSAAIARLSRPQTTAVAGFDLTFSPVKSVSTLWALAPAPLAAQIERAHHAAVADTIRFLETHALFTREGAGGVRQVDVTGMIATAFTHRDSRAGDPDLHTHLAVANKVQTQDGRWLAIDGRILFKATVAASETYNTALEQHLTEPLGVTFAERPSSDRQKRPVRELVGVDPRLMERWSARRRAITDRQADLTAAFQAAHGRPPTPVEAVRLAQQATLETRQAKHSPRTLAQQRTAWHAEARQVLGSDAAIHAMISTALHPTQRQTDRVDAAWVAETAALVVEAVERRRATWQTWHVRAEAQRRVRIISLPRHRSEALVDLIVDTALTEISTRLARPAEPVTEPAQLRRRDGSSVYTVAGSDLHTSPRILAAEQRLVEAAARTDGHVVTSEVVSLALLEATANGVRLDDGQARLVRDLATSGRRLQLAIAPAGAGKTTALHALTTAWTAGGGTVVGLAPSAAAAAQLADHTQLPTDTLAQLAWNLDHGTSLPAWAYTIDARSLVIIDEAGMADTLSLDTAVTWITNQGASVRLVGDDQQLAAIGAGGVLRDIDTTHGASRLTQLHRFTDPAEAAATLALRDGLPEALGFYLDQHRVHVADPTTITDHLFTGWAADTTTGADALMLTATRDQAADLNARARTHRLTTSPNPDSVPDRDVLLADGNRASVGDLIITRTNNRALRTTTTDWVKNGDRWTVTGITDTGHLTAQHRTHGHHVTLPPDYLTRSVELGYATTIHAAQGVTADTTHGLITGTETRQQLYTMATRGRTGNHLYVTVGVDGDPHDLIRPDATHPRTATDILEQVLARDGAATSATTLQRQLDDPAARLGDAAARYTDALHTAAEHGAGPHTLARLERHADHLLPGLTDQPAWPTLRAHLALIAAAGDPAEPVLDRAATSRELGTAADPAAVLTWRLHHPTLQRRGPLPWLTGIPPKLADHADWGPYLSARAQLVTDLAQQVRGGSLDAAAGGSPPSWAAALGPFPDSLIGEVAVWRAATGVEPTDHRATGPRHHAGPPAAWQRRLDHHLGDRHHEALAEWQPALTRLAPATTKDPYTAVLAVRLANLSRAGHPARDLLHTAAAAGPLPDDHPAAALWWRIRHHLDTHTATAADTSTRLQTDWRDHLVDQYGADRANSFTASPWWHALATQIDRNLQRGTPLDQLIPAQPPPGLPPGVDEAQVLTWRAQILTEPPAPADRTAQEEPPNDLWDGVDPGSVGTLAWTPDQVPREVLMVDTASFQSRPGVGVSERRPELGIAAELAATPDPDEAYLNADLAVAALAREAAGPLPPSDAMLQHAHDRAMAWRNAPVTRERLLHITELAATYYENQLPGSWADTYLTDRLNHHLTGDPVWRPGRAPAAWAGLVTHLHRHDVTDHEMVLAGLASYGRTGTLIDRFRDRLILPILDNHDVLGFVGRANPTTTDPRTPKYLNTPDSLLFHKRDQLYGLPRTLPVGSTPVLVEGPLDAIAVTLAGGRRYFGAASLGTALTEQQSAQLAHHRIDPIVTYDNDAAGQVAAQRAYWRLALHQLSPLMGQLPAGVDPAQWIHEQGPQTFLGALQRAQPLAHWLLGRALDEDPVTNLNYAVLLTGLNKPSEWNAAMDEIAAATATPPAVVRALLLHAVSTPGRGLQHQHCLDPASVFESSRTDVGSHHVLLAEARGRDQRVPRGRSEPNIARDDAVRR